jgi:hypothetical protein
MNNQYEDCPAIMSDGRLFTNYTPRCLQEYRLEDAEGRPLTSFQYRQFLIDNGKELIRRQQMAAMPSPHAPVPRAQRLQACDNRGCHMSSLQPGGLGLERG